MVTLPPEGAPLAPPTRRPVRERRPWAVTVIACLLLLEASGFLALSSLYLGPLGLSWPLPQPLEFNERSATLTGLVFAALALGALAGSLGFFRLRRGGWVSAVFVQGAGLFLALALYFRGRPTLVPHYAYLMMFVGIFMVLYLHQADVQAAFRENAPSSGGEQP